mgnify:CR=1 FL=1
MESLTHARVQSAIHKKISTDGVMVQVLGSEEEVLPALQKDFTGESIISKSYDADPVEIW